MRDIMDRFRKCANAWRAQRYVTPREYVRIHNLSKSNHILHHMAKVCAPWQHTHVLLEAYKCTESLFVLYSYRFTSVEVTLNTSLTLHDQKRRSVYFLLPLKSVTSLCINRASLWNYGVLNLTLTLTPLNTFGMIWWTGASSIQHLLGSQTEEWNSL